MYDFLDDPYYKNCYCRYCGERISFEEYEENDALCDYCYDKYLDDLEFAMDNNDMDRFYECYLQD